MARISAPIWFVLAGIAVAFVPAPASAAQPLGDTLREARAAEAGALARARAWEAAAQRETRSAGRAQAQAAALAARVQGAEAALEAAQLRLSGVRAAQRELDRALAAQRAPLARLAAALQRLAARPPVLGLIEPRSLAQTVRIRAVLGAVLPIVEARTARLRADLARRAQLTAQARGAVARLAAQQRALTAQRLALAQAVSRHRLAARSAGAAAGREARRAEELGLAARDLDALTRTLARDAALRARLAALPGPKAMPAAGQHLSASPAASRNSPAPDPRLGTGLRWQLPVRGRLLAGFGEQAGERRTQGVTLAAGAGAQAVAPAAGRVVFAGPYRGYGNVVILDHGPRWTSVLSGLVRLDVAVGERVARGAPLGAAAGAPVRFEVRRDAVPVDPLQLVLGSPNGA